MTPGQARGLKTELEAVSKQAQRLVDGMDAAALTRRPASAGWSVAENLKHLILTADAMLPLAETAVAQLERDTRKATGTSGLGFMGWLLTRILEPPARMKSKTTRPFQPVSVGDPLSLLGRFQETNDHLGSLIARSEGLATSTVEVMSPFNARVRYNLYAAFRIMLCHVRRHLWQAGQVKAGGG